jgi:hypothetical protein
MLLKPYKKLFNEKTLHIKSSEENKEYSKKLETLNVKKLKLKNDGTLNGAIYSALSNSLKYNKSCYIFEGNSYGHKIYQITFKKNDACDSINNMTNIVIEITPDKKYIIHTLNR